MSAKPIERYVKNNFKITKVINNKVFAIYKLYYDKRDWTMEAFDIDSDGYGLIYWKSSSRNGMIKIRDTYDSTFIRKVIEDVLRARSFEDCERVIDKVREYFER